jgi:hypothetical protein
VWFVNRSDIVSLKRTNSITPQQRNDYLTKIKEAYHRYYVQYTPISKFVTKSGIRDFKVDDKNLPMAFSPFKQGGKRTKKQPKRKTKSTKRTKRRRGTRKRSNKKR